MRRRRYLALTASTFVAGCTGEGDTASTPTRSPSPTATPTSTPKPTPTPTPEPQSPEITESSLLYRWREFGDVADNQVEAVGKGADAIIGFHYTSMVHDGTSDITEQVRVFGPEDNRVGLQSDTDEQLVSGSGLQEWEHALYFDTTTWDMGEHSYEVLIRDNVTNKVSETEEGQFEVNGPLGAQEASLISVDAPDTVSVGQDYSFTLELENQSSRDGSVVSTISAKYESSTEWTTYTDSKITATIPVNGTNTWESAPISFEDTGTIQYRLDAIDEIWEVEVTSN